MSSSQKGKIRSRSQLKEYCLRKLGAPVLQINVADEQVEDRIDDAIDFFNMFHEDSSARIFHRHMITADDMNRRSIIIPDDVLYVHRVLPINSADNSYGTSTKEEIFDPVYQMKMSDYLSFGSVSSSSLQYYQQWGEHIRMTEFQTSGTTQEFDFTRYENELKIRVEWGTDIIEGQWIVIEADRILISDVGLDPYASPVEEQISIVWNDMFLKEYSTALIKEQWGMNLTKYQGIQMPGGVMFDGSRILQEAREDIIRIKEEARNVWEDPLGTVYMG